MRSTKFASGAGSVWIRSDLNQLRYRSNGVTYTAGVNSGVILTDAAQTITTATLTPITWGTEVSDPDGWTSGGIATLTVPAGLGRPYVITYNGSWNLSTASAACAISINGTATYVGNDNAQFNTMSVTAMRTLAAGDTISVSVIHAAGANRDIVSRLEIH